MAKTGIKNNIPANIRKIDEDLSEITSTIGEVTAELVNVAFLDAQKRRILDGVGKSIGDKYLDVNGANISSRNQPGRKTFHKTKVVTRDGSIPKAFNQVQFTMNKNKNSKTIATGTNGVAKVKIENIGPKDAPTKQIATITWDGKIGDSLRNLHFGSSSGPSVEVIKDDKPLPKRYRRGQRKIARGALATALSRWKALVKAKLNGTLDKRNKVKPK